MKQVISEVDSSNVYNQSFIDKFRNIDYATYEIQMDNQRLDLIAMKLYPSEWKSMMYWLIIWNGKSIFNKGEIIRYLSTDYLQSILGI